MTVRSLIAATALFALTACNQSDFVPAASFDQTTTSGIRATPYAPERAYTLAHAVSPTDAMVVLPKDAGRVLQVSEAAGNASRRQVTTYAASGDVLGENRLTVTVDRDQRPPTRAALQREWTSEISGVSMRYRGLGGTNAYGSFHYASGKRGATLCMFAWQQVSARTVRGRLRLPFGRNPARLHLRLRLCRAGALERQLASVMERLTIRADPQNALEATTLRWQGAPTLPAPQGLDRVDEQIFEPQAEERTSVAERKVDQRRATTRQAEPTATTAFVPLPKNAATTTIANSATPPSKAALVPLPSSVVAADHIAAKARAKP